MRIAIVSVIRVLVLVVTTVAYLGCASRASRDVQDQIAAAEKEFAEARSESDYRRVAQLYEQITNAGFVSGLALYNEGNAHMKAGQTGKAIASYRQAMRYLPREPRLAANLELARGKPLDDGAALSVLDYVFVWQSWLSYREKYQLATLFIVVALSISLYSKWKKSHISWHRLSIIMGVVAALFAASAMVDWHRFERRQHGVLISQTVARKGNSENYEPAFKQPLAEGTEFTVGESRGEWLRATFRGDVQGWVPRTAAAVY